MTNNRSTNGLSARNKKKKNHKKSKKVNNPDTSKDTGIRPKSPDFNIHQLYKKKPSKEELDIARKSILERFKRTQNPDLPGTKEGEV